MPSSSLPTPCLDLFARGRWREAWTAAAERTTGAWLQTAGLDDLLWLHTLLLRIGRDVQRRALARTIGRRHPERLATRALVAQEHLRCGRLVEAWHACRDDVPAARDADEQVEWLRTRARLHAHLHDPASAAAAIAEARERAPDDVAVEIEAAWTLHDADRIDEAIATCERTIARWPDDAYPRVQLCWLLHDSNSPTATAALAATRLLVQSPPIDAAYATICHENGDLTTARTVFAELLAQPCHERRQRVAWHFALARVCRELGDDEAAHAALAEAGRHGRTAAGRLRAHIDAGAPAAGRRVVLPVPFVRQDHMTCSPATMASLLRTFGQPIDQREIAGQITYDGTASHDELVWAQQRGLVARTFEFEPGVARTLLDRGLPFAVTTRFETSGHRQAVVGYDGVFDSFVLRDPTGNFRREVPVDWLHRITARGGSCMLLLPAEVAAARPTPPLPLERETMAWLQVQIDWRHHRHADADRRLAELDSLPPGPLRFEVRTRTAAHRGDRRTALELWRSAHEAAPQDPYWQYHYAVELLDQNRWHEARSRIETWAGASRSPHLRRLLADQLRHDARRRREAKAILRRALRWLGRDARAWHRYAAVAWDLGDRAEAVELYRLAATMAPTDEQLASSHFWALYQVGRVEIALQYLRERCERLGARSAAAAGTLAESLETLHRADEAVEVLRAAVDRHDAPEQRRHLFELLLRLHRLTEASALLDAPGWAPFDREFARHAFARRTGDHAAALAALDRCVAIDPWHTGAQRQRLLHVLEHDGEGAAVAAADQLVAAHGESPALMVVVAEFFDRVEDRARERRLLQRLVDDHPHEHWLRGRLARHLLHTGAVDAARPLLEQLQQTSPDSSAVWGDVATLAHLDGDGERARAAARRAFELSPDHGAALRRLCDWARDRDEAADDVRAAMRAVTERPVPPDEAILGALARVASAVPVDEFRAFLQRLERDFPATPAILVARCEFERDRDDAQALQLAEALVAREPWRSTHRLRHAACLRAVGRADEGRAALERLLDMDPGCAQACADLGEALERQGRLAEAMAVYERGIGNSPGSATLHGMVADAAWRLGDRKRALATVARACELDRSYAWAFRARAEWLLEEGQPDAAAAVVDRLVADTPSWPHGHEIRAEILGLLGRHDERIAALRRALALSPRLGETRLLLVDALIALKQFDAAREVLREGTALHGDDPRLLLRELEIDRTLGRLAEARRGLRALLDRHPDFQHGWGRYLRWCDEEGRHLDILQLHRDPPVVLRDEPMLLGYAADAFRRRGDTSAAMQTLSLALEREPGYDWARDTLCDLALAAGQPERVLELLPDHADPAALPFHRAVLVGRAAARRRDRTLLGRVLLRLLHDPEANGEALRTVADLHRELDPKAHAALLRDLGASAAEPGPAAENRLRLLAGRGRWHEFFDDLSRLQAAVGGSRGDAVAARLLADARRQHASVDVLPWVAANIRPPVTDTTAMGHLLFALRTDRVAGAAQALRLFGDDWQRPDVEGWMLANLADALHTLGRRSLLVRVCRHALDHVPHDHSIWWHRRYLAEVALDADHLAEARALCEMEVDAFHDVRLQVHLIDLIAALRQTQWWQRWRLLAGRWPELWRRYDAARADGDTTVDPLRAWRLFRLCPSLRTLLLQFGTAGIWLARRF